MGGHGERERARLQLPFVSPQPCFPEIEVSYSPLPISFPSPALCPPFLGQTPRPGPPLKGAVICPRSGRGTGIQGSGSQAYPDAFDSPSPVMYLGRVTPARDLGELQAALCFVCPYFLLALGVWAVTHGWSAFSVLWAPHSFSNWGGRNLFVTFSSCCGQSCWALNALGSVSWGAAPPPPSLPLLICKMG